LFLITDKAGLGCFENTVSGLAGYDQMAQKHGNPKDNAISSPVNTGRSACSMTVEHVQESNERKYYLPAGPELSTGLRDELIAFVDTITHELVRLKSGGLLWI
jgi:hypothetical protein